MAGQQVRALVYGGLRGRDGSTTSIVDIPDHKAIECLNVDGFRAGFARKRGGSRSFSLTGSGLTGRVSAAFRHVPGADDTAAEIWLVCSNGVWARHAAGAWSNPTLTDALTGNAVDVQAASFNGKLYFAYKSGVDRLHVWDPVTGTIRRTGLAAPTAGPTVADTGAGTYAATIRYYRVRWAEVRSGSTYRLSEASAATPFTPSGTGTAARITRPTPPGEGETHWHLEEAVNASTGPFYVIASTAIATTTYDDSAATTAVSGLGAAPTAGEYINWTSVKYLIADDNRLLGAGAHESGNPVNTVYVSPVMGTTSALFFDDERVPTTTANRLEFNERDSGFIVGFGMPYDNQVIVLKDRQAWRMIGTGVATAPYRRKPITRIIGALNQKCIVLAEDEAGNPALYWLGQQGPYRLAHSGMARLTGDIQDIWATMNFAASTIVAHGVFHADIHQIWWWVSVNSENEPGSTRLVYDTKIGRVIEAGEVRDGWYKHDGESAKARCSVMAPNVISTTTSRDLKPYIGQNGGNTRFWKCDTADLNDNGTAFQGLVTLPDRHIGGLSHRCALGHPAILGNVGTHSLTVTQRRNYGAATRSDSVSMEAVEGDETRVLKVLEGVETSDDAIAVGLTVGDDEAVSASWTIDRVSQPYEVREAIPA